MAIHEQLKDLLLESGLSEAETLIYVELLKKPAESVQDLARRSGLSKSSAHRAFSRLKELKMIDRIENEIRALSLKSYVSELKSKQLHLRKISSKIKQIAPFLRMPNESIEELEHFYTQDQIANAYLFMSEQNYNTNLDFGDFESFIPKIGGIEIGNKFRANRVKHAGHHAICTTFGPYSAYYSTREAEKNFKNNVDKLDLDFKKKFIIFSDSSDYVLFNEVGDDENLHGILVKSKTVADIQRAQFDLFSQKAGKVYA